MKLIFQVNYRTDWGETLYISGSPEAMGAGDTAKAIPMTLSGSETWSVTIELPDSLDLVTYSYIVRRDNGAEKHE